MIQPYTARLIPAVAAFNRRLLAGGADPTLVFPETPDPGWMPHLELFVSEEDDAVHGGYILRHQNYSAAGKSLQAAHYRLPLSEGIVDRSYAMLGYYLLCDALDRQPRLYAMGMGGWDKPLPKMLKTLEWRMCAIPFHFKVIHPARFLRNIRALRTTPLRRLALDAAALTGAAWVVLRPRRVPAPRFTLEPGFTPWAADIWQRSRAAYALLADRDPATLDALYPPSDARFIRVRTDAGWAVLLDTPMRDHKQFGDLRVGTIVDCLAPPESAADVVRAAAAVLQERGVDLIVSNQLHTAWSRALLDSGFRLGPSNYLLALSPDFAAQVAGAPDDHLHFNRGDGDGPIHL